MTRTHRDQPSEDRTGAPVLVSACLLGRACRYDGRHVRDGVLLRRLGAEGRRAIPFCPEEAGGLPTPRPAAWIERGGASDVLEGGSRIVTSEGDDVTDRFLAGARGALATCREEGADRALLKEGSPSCGVDTTHVAGIEVGGMGVTAALLRDAGILVEGVEGDRE